MDPTDAVDWDLVLVGDTAALGRFFDRHHQRLFRHALGVVGDREDAQDAVAVAFFELWRKRASVRLVDGSPLPWLITATSFAARNVERSARRYRRMLARVPRDEEASAAPAVHDETGVFAALKRLPAAERDVVVLAVLEGFPERETAQTLGIPEGTVKSRLARAKRRLRGEIESWELA
ncbi:MAG: RNA polymerase sigma factor [Microbacterium sp.]